VQALLERYAPDLERYVARHAGGLVRARESSSDLAQSVCREVLERLADGRFRYAGEAAFRQWLYRAAVMKMLQRHRHWQAERRDPAREVGRGPVTEEHGLSALAAGATPSEDAIRIEELERFREAFERLAERDQDLIRLHHAEGRTHAEIAAELGISEASSRMALSRALARLAKLAVPRRPG
jgi:RNA polymerase sigma-70 factor (ECF subfamily)